MRLFNKFIVRCNEVTLRQFLIYVSPFVLLSYVFYLSVPHIPKTSAIWGTTLIEIVKTVGYLFFLVRLFDLYKRTKVNAFRIFFYAVLVWMPGQIIQSITPITGNTPYIYSNSADIFLIAAVAIVVWGVLSIGLYGLERRDKTQILVNAITFGACVAFIATIFVSKVWLGSKQNLAQAYVGDFISLTLDIVLIAVCLSMALFRRRDHAVVLICFGLFFQSAADLLYLAATFQGLDSTRPIQRILIITALMFWISCSLVENPKPVHKGSVRSEVMLAIGSYLAVGFVIVFAFTQATSLGNTPDVVIYSFLFTFVAIFIAQVIGFFDNKRLVYQQQQSIEVITKSEEKFQELATHDTLTNLDNRTSFIDALKNSIEECKKSSDQLAVLFIDLDRFKEINDTYGHSVGDSVICELAERIKSVIGNRGLVSRLGGDEFAVLCFGEIDRNSIYELAKEILNSATNPIVIAGSESYLSCSIGIAISSGDEVDSQTMLRNADSAMYRAKELGRNRIEFSDDVVKPLLEMNGWTLSELHQAIVSDQIDVYYQPIYDLAKNKITSFEALCRWDHPKIGMVDPEEFIAVAEDNGLIIELGNSVVRKSIEQLGRWGRADISVNINLSFRQLNDPELIGNLKSLCLGNAVSTSQVNFEMTESALLGDVKNAISVLNEIVAQGFKIFIDDFGTGYSSLSYLKKFPIAGFKIDMNYVQGYGTDEDDTAIVNSLVGLGQSMNLQVTAEGVDNENTHVALKKLGCTFAQGFLYSKAIPADDVIFSPSAPVNDLPDISEDLKLA